VVAMNVPKVIVIRIVIVVIVVACVFLGHPRLVALVLVGFGPVATVFVAVGGLVSVN
jgi:hypothetical protein